MTAQQLAGSKVPCENACPEGNTAPSLQSTSFRLLTTIWSSPGAPGAYPTAQPLYCTCTGETAPKGQLRGHPPYSRDGEGWAAVPVAHRSQLSHGCRHQAARKTVTSDVPERCRRVLGSVSCVPFTHRLCHPQTFPGAVAGTPRLTCRLQHTTCQRVTAKNLVSCSAGLPSVSRPTGGRGPCSCYCTSHYTYFL